MSNTADRRIHIRASLIAMVIVVMIMQMLSSLTSAADLLTRSVLIGSSFAGDVTTHTYSFRSTNTSTVGSMQFEYCANSPLFDQPCVPPAGLDTSSFTIDSQSGITGFTPSAATTNEVIVMNRTISSEPATPSVYELGNIQNPSSANQTVYVRISVFDLQDGVGALVDQGAVAFVVDERFDVQAYVPPYLTFCVAIVVSIDCSSSSGFITALGELQSTQTAVATTQFAAATNDIDGYNTYVNGQTLTSGNNVISQITSGGPSAVGQSQFGINLRSNTSPVVGAELENGLVASGYVDAAYNSPNIYRFSNGDRIAGSDVSTGFNRYTVSYIVNVNEDQAPGVYSTTLTYTALATF